MSSHKQKRAFASLSGRDFDADVSAAIDKIGKAIIGTPNMIVGAALVVMLAENINFGSADPSSELESMIGKLRKMSAPEFRAMVAAAHDNTDDAELGIDKM